MINLQSHGVATHKGVEGLVVVVVSRVVVNLVMVPAVMVLGETLVARVDQDVRG